MIMPAIEIDRIEGIDAAIEESDKRKCGFVMLGHGRFALVDFDDMPKASKLKWVIHTGGYAKTKIGRKDTYLHRLICQTSEGMEVDHKNLNKLDNRRGNLRACTKTQNKGNCLRRRHNKTSVFKGVRFMRKTGKFTARGIAGGKEKSLGVFDSEIEAAIAYNKWAVQVFGEFANLNIVS